MLFETVPAGLRCLEVVQKSWRSYMFSITKQWRHFEQTLVTSRY